MTSAVRAQGNAFAPPAAAAIAVEPAEARPDPLLYAIAAVLFTAVWRLQDLFPLLAPLRPTITSLGAALVLFALNPRGRRSLSLLRSAPLGLALLLLVLLVIGAPVSIWPGGSVAFLITDFIPSIILAVLIAAAVRSVRDLEFLMTAMLIAAAVFSVFVLLTVQVEATGRLGRLRYYDVNDLALLLVSSMPIAVLLLRRGSGAVRGTLAIVCLAIFIVALVRSGSRGGFLAFLAVSAYMLLRYRALPARVRGGAVVGGALLLLVAGGSRYWQMMQTILHPKQDYNWAGNTYDGRMELWKRGLTYVGERPVLGLGAAAFPVAEGTISATARQRRDLNLTTKWSVAHNAYIHIAAEAGLPGFIVFVAMLIAAFRAMGRVGRRTRDAAGDPRIIAAAQALTGALLGYSIAQIFISAQYFGFLYVLIGLIAGLQKLQRLDGVRLVPAR